MKSLIRAVSAFCVAIILVAFIATVVPGLRSVLATYSYYLVDPLTTENLSYGATWFAPNTGYNCPSFNSSGMTTNPLLPPGCDGIIFSKLGAGQEVLFAYGTGDNWAYLGAEYSSNTLYTTGWTVYTNGSTITIYKQDPSSYGSTSYTLATVTHSLSYGDQIRAITTHGGLAVYANDQLMWFGLDPSGYGVGGSYLGIGVDSGSYMNGVALGYLDTIAPTAIPSSSFSVTPFANYVDVAWPAASDDPSGTGIAYYLVSRNGGTPQLCYCLSFVDSTVEPATTYSYTITAVDFHLNSASTTISVTTPHVLTSGPFPSSIPDGRRVGVRPTGAYWGAGNEEIDVMSGNVNFTTPIVTAMQRGGSSVPFVLSYNSQNWRHDSGGTWQFGEDVGYGYGWKLMAGSITPVYSDAGYTVSYFLFTDSSGAQYRLDQNSGSLWTSKESVYATFDASTGILHFSNGSYWTFGCVSATTEPDSGVAYPTVMEDANGNQIFITYNTAAGANWTNSSSRIATIEDVRAVSTGSAYVTYAFSYTTFSGDSIPHLTSVSNNIGTSEAYGFSYSSSSLASPISPFTSFGTTRTLSSVTSSGINTSSQFTYGSNNSGELIKAVLPYGGYLSWDYENVAYSSGVTYREVAHRYLSKDGTSTTTTYGFSHEGTPGAYVRQYTILDDPDGVGERYWTFNQSGTAQGLASTAQGRSRPGPVALQESDVTWTQDSAGNSYISSVIQKMDPGQSYEADSRTDEVLDTHGDVTQVSQYDFGNLTTPARTYNYTYLTSSGYTSRYILNRLSGASVTSGTTTTLVTNTYDQSMPTGSGDPSREWDSANYSGVTTRGSLTTSATVDGTQTITYDLAGNPTGVTSNGVATTASTTSTTNFAAPSALSSGSLSQSFSYTAALSPSSTTGPDGGIATTTYDSYGRLSGWKSPFKTSTGNSTSTTYSSAPYTSTNAAVTTTTASLDGRFSRTTLDGLGRSIKRESSDSSTVKSVAESVYGSAACAPLGKLLQRAVPHAPGATPVYTTYTYDGIGRTLSAVAPDGLSTTTYVYQGNTVQQTDPAGKWKLFTLDAFGHLTQVTEPNPLTSRPAPLSPPPAGSPEFSPAPGTYSSSQSVSIASSTSGATIYYTTNGTTPSTTNGSLYSGAISIGTATVLQAVAYSSGLSPSMVTSGGYSFSGGGTVVSPSFSPAPGTYSASQTLTISTSTSGATIRYTTDGSGPTEGNGTLYSSPLSVSASTTLRAIAYASGMTDSAVSSGTYVIQSGAGSTDYITTYTYDVLGNPAGVSMARSSGTQTRTFVYSGHRLTSATNPENGTVTLTYNSNNKLATRTDAKGATAVYTYDSLGRLTKTQRYPTGTGGSEDTCQQENYAYDSNPYSSFTTNASGRLAAMQYYGGPSCNTTFTENYNYSAAGGRIGKQLQVARSGSTVNLEADYTYDTEGKLLTEQYPLSGPHLGIGYDSLSRQSTLTDLGSSSTIISAVTYGPSNEVLSISGTISETRTYNSMVQLTSIASSNSSGGAVNITYAYSGSQNNGKIATMTDNISGEQVVYNYDALNRLLTATATSGSWGQSYNYDGFGNLTDQNVTAGSAPAYHVTYDYSTNRQTGECADLNGNLNSSAGSCGTLSYNYDVSNRVTSLASSSPTWQYSYAPHNKRIWRGVWTGSTLTTDEVTFWGANGQRLGTYQLSLSGSTLTATNTNINEYFIGRLIKNNLGYVAADRLGSIGHFYPWGQEKPSATANETEKFTGYFRDAETGNDYALNRYHIPGAGRFLTTDPHAGSAQASNPGSWNRYAYVTGDPINSNDPTGKDQNGLGCAEAYNSFVCSDGTNPFTGLPDGTALNLGLIGIDNTGNTSLCIICTENVDSSVTFDPGDDCIPCASQVATQPDTAIDPLGQTVFNLMSGYNVEGFTNFAGAVTVGIPALVFGGAGLASAISIPAAATTAATALAPTGYVFYSGTLEQGMQQAAEAFAVANNAITIGMTQFGAAIENGTMGAAAASEAFASSMSGTAYIFSTAPFQQFGNIWFNYELPALMSNPNFTNLVVMQPTSPINIP